MSAETMISFYKVFWADQEVSSKENKQYANELKEKGFCDVEMVTSVENLVKKLKSKYLCG